MKFAMVGYSGNQIETGFWGKLVIDVEGIKAAPRIPVLRQHEPTRIVGTTENVVKENGQLVASGFFHSTADAKEVEKLLGEGYPWQASMGIWPKEIQRLSKDESAIVNGKSYRGPMSVWTKSHLRELSFVSLGADSDTSAVGIAASAQGGTRMKINWVKLAQEFQQGAFSRPINPDRADVVLASLASELEAAENITFIAAANKVLNDDPDLCANYLYPS